MPPPVELWLLETLAAELDQLDECLGSGMLTGAPARVAFRHELARLAVEEAMGPNRRVALHHKALAALADPPSGAPELARLAHHAEAAGDREAVLEFAPAAAARPLRWARTARQPHSTRGRSGSRTGCRPRHGPSCSSAARTSAT